MKTNAPDAPEQLAFPLPAADVPLQFRLDERTRRSGLAHVAALRAQMAAQAAKRDGRQPAATITRTTPARRLAA